METTLLIDGNNNFIRNYVTYSSTTSNGEPYGGVVGFLRSLASFTDLTKPQRVVVIFDGPGGSQRRRAIYSEYKEGRKPSRLNRHVDESIEDQTDNKRLQEIALAHYLQDLPVHIIRLPNIEADDVIAYLSGYFEGRKVIVSNDMDFYQLLSTDVIMYKPTKKSFYTGINCHEDHGIYPVNFGLARAVVGDRSDNIKGIKGVGLKTLIKLVPHFAGKDEMTLEDLMRFCGEQEGSKYKLFVENQKLIADNYSIMSLRDPLISSNSISKIKEAIQAAPSMNNTSLRMKLMRDGIDIGNNFLQTFLKLSLAGKSKQYV